MLLRLITRVNLRNLDDSISLCAICDTRMHWAKACPYVYEKERPQATIYYGEEFPRFWKNADHYFRKKNSIATQKWRAYSGNPRVCSFRFGMLDNSVREMWLQYYLDTLTSTEKASIKCESSSSVYRFGDCECMKAEKSLILPCVLAGTPVSIWINVVTSNIPLLLRRSSIKKAGMIIDFSCDQATIFGKQVHLETTSMGQYTATTYCVTLDETEGKIHSPF